MPYCTVAEVANAARNIEINGGLTGTMTEGDAGQFIAEAGSLIDSALSPIIYTPVKQITRDSVTSYPNPIPFIARRLAAALMVRSVYSRIDSQMSQVADAHYSDAYRELMSLVDDLRGGRMLDGQQYKARNFFAHPTASPLVPPRG